MCGFLENNKCLHLSTAAIVTLFLLQTDPGPHQRRKKLCGPHRKQFGDPWTWASWLKTIASFCARRNAPADLHSDPPGCGQCEAVDNSTGWGGLDLSQARRGHHQCFKQRSGSSCIQEVSLHLYGARGRAARDPRGDGGGHKPGGWAHTRPCSHFSGLRAAGSWYKKGTPSKCVCSRSPSGR